MSSISTTKENQKMSDKIDVIARIPRNENEQIYITQTEFMSKTIIHLRIFFKDKNGEYRPSPKGVPIPIDQWESFLEGIQKASFRVAELKNNNS